MATETTVGSETGRVGYLSVPGSNSVAPSSAATNNAPTHSMNTRNLENAAAVGNEIVERELLVCSVLEHMRRRLSWRKWYRSSGLAYAEPLTRAAEREWVLANGLDEILREPAARKLTIASAVEDEYFRGADMNADQTRAVLLRHYEDYLAAPDHVKFLTWYLEGLSRLVATAAKKRTAKPRTAEPKAEGSGDGVARDDKSTGDETDEGVVVDEETDTSSVTGSTKLGEKFLEQYRRAYFRPTYTIDFSTRALDDSTIWYYFKTLYGERPGAMENAGMVSGRNGTISGNGIVSGNGTRNGAVSGNGIGSGSKAGAGGNGIVSGSKSGAGGDANDDAKPFWLTVLVNRELRQISYHTRNLYLRMGAFSEVLKVAPSACRAADQLRGFLDIRSMPIDGWRKSQYPLPVDDFPRYYLRLATMLNTYHRRPRSSRARSDHVLYEDDDGEEEYDETCPFTVAATNDDNVNVWTSAEQAFETVMRNPDAALRSLLNSRSPSNRRLQSGNDGDSQCKDFSDVTTVGLSFIDVIDECRWTIAWRPRRVYRPYTRLSPTANAAQLLARKQTLAKGQDAAAAAVDGMTLNGLELDPWETVVESVSTSWQLDEEKEEFDEDDGASTGCSAATDAEFSQSRGSKRLPRKLAIVLSTNVMVHDDGGALGRSANRFLLHETNPRLASVFVPPDQDPFAAYVLDPFNDATVDSNPDSPEEHACLRWVLVLVDDATNGKSLRRLAASFDGMRLLLLLRDLQSCLREARFRVDTFLSRATPPEDWHWQTELQTSSATRLPYGTDLFALAKRYGTFLLGKPCANNYSPADTALVWQSEPGFVPWTVNCPDVFHWKLYSNAPVDSLDPLVPTTMGVNALVQGTRNHFYALTERYEIQRFLVATAAENGVIQAPAVRLVTVVPLPLVVYEIVSKRVFALEDGTVFVTSAPLKFQQPLQTASPLAGKMIDRYAVIERYPIAVEAVRGNKSFKRAALFGSEIWLPVRLTGDGSSAGRCYSNVPSEIAPIVEWLDRVVPQRA